MCALGLMVVVTRAPLATGPSLPSIEGDATTVVEAGHPGIAAERLREHRSQDR